MALAVIIEHNSTRSYCLPNRRNHLHSNNSSISPTRPIRIILRVKSVRFRTRPSVNSENELYVTLRAKLIGKNCADI